MPTRQRRLYANNNTAEVICQLPIDTLRTKTAKTAEVICQQQHGGGYVPTIAKENDKDKDAKRRTETLTVCYIFGILIQCSTTQYRQVPLSRYSRALLSTTK